jgi:hypothetical protein
MNEKSILKIQKIVRIFLKKLNFGLVESKFQTKDWRKNQKWYFTGKSNECEKFQINILEKILETKWKKCYDRINYEKLIIENIRNPMVNDNGFEFSENFDGKIEINKLIIYFNLKFICDSGGSQTRSLREVYLFIKYQLKYLKNIENKNIFFIYIY